MKPHTIPKSICTGFLKTINNLFGEIMKDFKSIKVNMFVIGFGNIAEVHHPKIIKQLVGRIKAVDALIFR